MSRMHTTILCVFSHDVQKGVNVGGGGGVKSKKVVERLNLLGGLLGLLGSNGSLSVWIEDLVNGQGRSNVKFA
jgi:hypothetical protein